MDPIVQKLKADYDAVAYDNYEHLHAHPDRISIIAALRGFPFTPVNDCRVLELGSATGSNLIPMSEQMPGSRFLGIELSERQVEVGAKLIAELGLTNIELRCQDIMELPEDIGNFDYIIAHGVYSWVPRPVQQAILRLCQRHLSPRGLAYISYNTYPGWRLKEIARGMMLYHTRMETDPMKKLARGREIVDFMSENSQGTDVYRMLLNHNAKTLSESKDRYVLHDHMETVNEPRHFSQFVQEARASGLQYIGEAAIERSSWATIPPDVREKISKICTDPIEQEQYLDFLVNRSFRLSVLCRADAAAVPSSIASRIRGMFIAGNPPDVPAGSTPQGQPLFQFGAGPHKVNLSDPRPIAVLRHLRQLWPSAAPFSELLSVALTQSPPGSDPDRIAEALAPVMETFFALGIVELWTHPTDRIAPTAGEYPRVTKYARWQAANRPTITSLRQTSVKSDDVMRQLAPLLDGTRDRTALIAELIRINKAGGAKAGSILSSHDSKQLAQMLEKAFEAMVPASLLVNE